MQEEGVIPRPAVLPGITVKVKTQCGNLYVTLNFYEAEVYEIFAWLGKAGGCMKANTEAITRAITAGLRRGIDRFVYVEQLKDIQCPYPTLFPKERRVLSCADAIAQVLSGQYVVKLDSVKLAEESDSNTPTNEEEPETFDQSGRTRGCRE